MAIKVRIPAGMRMLTGNRAEVEAGGSSVMELIKNLEKAFPGLQARLLDDQGRKRKFVNIYVNSEDTRFLQQESTALKERDEVDIVAAVAGG